VLVTGFPAGSFAANCYLVAPAPGEECVIVDPGEGAERGIDELAAKYRLKPIAVLLTHGHIDHVWSVAPVCGARDVPAYIHPDDRELLSNPARGFPLGPGQQLFGGLALSEPEDVRELIDGTVLRLAGLEITVDHAPGHTPGSVTFRVPGETHGDTEAGAAPEGTASADGARGGILFSGDLLFAGSIGRTDLPGGDYQTIMDSLAKICLTLPAATIVLPGHGPQTSIGAERATNPFLAPITADPGGAVRERADRPRGLRATGL
jgi:glyoxylase-like metal-dependent hydrolase (beta-lactamase superfamily II)